MATIPRFFQDPGTHFFLFGPRGTGKSTWLRAQLPDALWLDLLSPDLFREYSARPERLRSRVRAQPDCETVVIDEVQKVPELLDVVHQLIEEGGGVRFVLTGSSSRKLKRANVDLMAGRALLERLHPFMAAELGDGFDLDRSLALGLVPLVWDAKHPAKVLASYAALYIREEVQMEGLVRNIGQFARFVEVVSFSHGCVLNTSHVARECQVSRKTVEAYVGILEDLLLAFRLPVFTRRAQRHLTAHPKFYWFDAGVYRATRPAGPLDPVAEFAGPALEGLVAQHLRAWIDLSPGDHSLGFWRTKSGNEVDFVIYGPAGFWAIEVKHSATIHPKDLRGLRAFHQDYPESTPLLLHRGPEPLLLGDILCLPVQDFLIGLRPGEPLH